MKPSNILITEQDGIPVPKIIDFGVAKATSQRLTERTLFTELGQLVGTPEYMSPEQAELTGEDIDIRTDIYSLGMVLYELLVGALPFDPKELRRAGLLELQRKIREDEPTKPSTRLTRLGDASALAARNRRTSVSALVKSLRGDVDWIVMKALDKDRNRRYETAHAFAQDVERFLADETVHARPPSPAYRAAKFVRRHRLAMAAGAAVLLALLAGILLATFGLARARRAERQATQEAETARQVSEFLVDIFEVADPGEARGNTVTARELLDEGATRIREQLGDQPLVQTRLMIAMGRVYTKLGLYSEADALLEDSVSALREQGDTSRVELATALHLLGVLYDTQGRYSEAQLALEEALQIREDLLGPTAAEVGRSLNSLAIVHWSQGDYPEAEHLLSRALTIKEKSLGPDDPGLSSSIANLAVLYHSQKKYAEAEPLFKRAVAITEKTLGPDHPDLAADLNNLGSLYEDQKRYSEAEPLYQRALAIWEKALGPEHSDVGIALHNLGNLYRNQGDHERAQPLYERSLSVFEQALGPDHLYVAIGLREQANSFRDQGDHARAGEYYSRSIEILEATVDEGHPEFAETRGQYNLLLQTLDKQERAAFVDSD
jgi:non-specific serine/threonine protein kinase/serine/threonine-protein kinase